MKSVTQYSKLQAVYDNWIANDPARLPSQRFYLDEAQNSAGTILEVGVGTGRIGLEIVLQGGELVGVDECPEMLQECRRRATLLGVKASRLSLIEANILDVTIERPISMVIAPLRTVGHFVTADLRRRLFVKVRQLLARGGTLIFDHFVFDDHLAERDDGVERLVHCTRSSAEPRVSLYHSHRCDRASRVLHSVLTRCVELPEGSIERDDIPYDLAWIEPEEIRGLCLECGFQEVAAYGSFDRTPLLPHSTDQIWILRRHG